MRLRALLLFSLLSALPLSPATAQGGGGSADTAREEIRAVLRAYYQNLQAGNWDALASYVLSPKLMERRGGPADSAQVWRDRSRQRVLAHAAAAPAHCPSPASPMLDQAVIQIDGDWADVSVPRCAADTGGFDELQLMFFEHRWRFIYTDMFQP